MTDKKINLYDLWTVEWNNAYKFFKSQGNTETLDKLKKKWSDDFFSFFADSEKFMKQEIIKKIDKKIKYWNNKHAIIDEPHLRTHICFILDDLLELKYSLKGDRK